MAVTIQDAKRIILEDNRNLTNQELLSLLQTANPNDILYTLMQELEQVTVEISANIEFVRDMIRDTKPETFAFMFQNNVLPEARELGRIQSQITQIREAFDAYYSGERKFEKEFK